jgi:hypothetical protein
MSEILENFEGEMMFPQIHDDAEAEECIQAIKAAEADVAFWKNYYADALQKIADASQRIIDNNTARLEAYFDTLPHKKTKTQESYPLPSAKLVRKHQDPEFVRDDEELLSWLKDNNGEKFIKVKESPDWAGLKKTLTVLGETVVDENGEIIPCIKATERPDVFKVE